MTRRKFVLYGLKEKPVAPFYFGFLLVVELAFIIYWWQTDIDKYSLLSLGKLAIAIVGVLLCVFTVLNVAIGLCGNRLCERLSLYAGRSNRLFFAGVIASLLSFVLGAVGAQVTDMVLSSYNPSISLVLICFLAILLSSIVCGTLISVRLISPRNEQNGRR